MKPDGDRTDEVRVDERDAGTRLDRFLADRFPQRTRSALRKLIESGDVRVDGATPPKAGFALEPGSVVSVRFPPAPPATLEPESIPLTIVHQDDHLVVIDKPAGLVVHPGHGHRSGTLVHGLLGLGIPLSPIGRPDRPGVVHRLDKDTSGLLVVAKTERAHRVLADAFASRRVGKTYRAIVWGHPRSDADTIDRPIGRSRRDPTRMAVGTGRGRRALSRFRVVETVPGFAVLEIDIETGRTHQIRVHMQSIHHPIVGDTVYGGRPWRGIQDPLRRNALRDLDRLALHAEHLAFEHPVSGRAMRLHAPWPRPLEALLARLRGEAP